MSVNVDVSFATEAEKQDVIEFFDFVEVRSAWVETRDALTDPTMHAWDYWLDGFAYLDRSWGELVDVSRGAGFYPDADSVGQ
jgi:hypothetical protein